MQTRIGFLMASRWMGLILMLSCITELTQAFGVTKPSDRLCRFYSNMTKTCKSACRDVPLSDVEFIMAKRGIDTRTLVSVAEINDPFIDPILFVKCTGEAVVSTWKASDGFAFTPAAPGSTYEKADVYVGACLLNSYKKHTWSCRGCDRQTDATSVPVDPIAAACFIGGEDGYKSFYKSGWQQTGDDESTLKLFHD